MKSFQIIVLISALISALSVHASQKKCEFEDLSLGSLSEDNSRFQNDKTKDKMVGLPKIFASYKDALGDFNSKDCKKSVRKTQFESLDSKTIYTFYYTNEDNCDGGNSYGLIIGEKANSPKKDGVIALITDGDISCL